MNLRSQWTRLGSLTLMLAFLAAASPSPGSALASTGSLDSLPGKARGSELAGSIKPSFEANVGQADPQVRFLSRGRGAQLFLTANEAVLRFGTSASATLRLRLLGAKGDVEPRGVDPLPGHSNYFVGNDPRNWRPSIANFGSVRYPEVYPGIDLAFHSAGRDFEYDFILQPGRTPHVITVDFVGPTHLTMDSEGNLVLATPSGNVSQKKPSRLPDETQPPDRC